MSLFSVHKYYYFSSKASDFYVGDCIQQLLIREVFMEGL